MIKKLSELPSPFSRRTFLRVAAAASGGLALEGGWGTAARGQANGGGVGGAAAVQLPEGSGPRALVFPHFPDRVHAFVWRNWTLVPVGRMAEVLGASPEDITRLGQSMGLPPAPEIKPDQQRRSYITVIRRNWHLLPYSQLLQLLGWTPEQMAFTLREDDFLFVKLGNLKPKCDMVRYTPPSEAVLARERQMAEAVRRDFPEGLEPPNDPLFGFVARLSAPSSSAPPAGPTRFAPRFCYSYFALYGDPLLDKGTDAYPEGYLAKLASIGVDGVWMQAVLHKLAPFPWDESLSARYEERLGRLGELVARARRAGIGMYLYLNEPRSMPRSFYQKRPELKGVSEGDHAALCTSVPEVQQWIVDSVARIGQAVPDLAGFFTISASENLTNCWSHNSGAKCPRCSKRSPGEVIAEVHSLVHRGMAKSGNKARLLAWDWGWADDWAESIISKLPKDVALMSVSEWSIPIRRGGIENRVGEYSISTVGPGPRALKHWQLAQQHGLKTIAKVQAGNTWELSAVPYIPALENVGRHAANLLNAKVDGIMLGWTLGGYPSPNLEVVMELARQAATHETADLTASVIPAMQTVAERRFGIACAPAVVRAWREFSEAFSEFPYDGGLVYNAPMQFGPSNLLWGKPTGYHATMIGFPYDDLDAWRGPYPAEVFIGQFQKVADGFELALSRLRETVEPAQTAMTPEQRQNLREELSVAEAAAIHFRSTANQATFVHKRRAWEAARNNPEAKQLLTVLERVLQNEITLARQLYTVQSRDSRIGFEATNHYYYVPLDLVEKVLNCRDLLERWLPAQRSER